MKLAGKGIGDWGLGIGKCIGALAIVLAATIGCSPAAKLQEMHPVHGKVVFQDGRPASGGQVLFRSEADANVTASGVIGPDGRFTLSSFIASARKSGAIPGKHRVLVTPPLDSTGPGVAWQGEVIERSYTVQPGDNDVTLTIRTSSR